jgi:rubrerythrin
MNKEKQIQDYERKELIEELLKMPPMVIATAYLHALNYTLYGEDVTEKWQTAIQNTIALEKAYKKGYYDSLQRQSGSWIPSRGGTCFECSECGIQYRWAFNFCPKCGADMRSAKMESEDKG